MTRRKPVQHHLIAIRVDMNVGHVLVPIAAMQSASATNRSKAAEQASSMASSVSRMPAKSFFDAQFVPDVLHRIQFRRIGRRLQQHDVDRGRELAARLMPAGRSQCS